MQVLGIIFMLMTAFTTEGAAQTSKVISFPKDADGSVALDVSLLDIRQELNSELLSVYVQDQQSDCEVFIAIQGDYKVEENSIIFKPYFPFEQGLLYEVKFKDGNTGAFKTVPFQIGQKAKVAAAELLDIYPSSTYLPENVLRFYFYFQTPMRQEEALKHIKLVDIHGDIDDHAFMKFKEELWSIDGTRLTLLFDPGRIKRGVGTNIAKGPALVDGQVYYLRISNRWRDIYGQELSGLYEKEIRVGKPYRTRMNLEKWLVYEPDSDSFDALTMDMDRIMDHALIHSMIQVKDSSGKLVRGYWEVLNAEKQMQFVPIEKWKKGVYRVEVDSRIEDVSGNNLYNLLDSSKEEKDLFMKAHTIYFDIK